jgi:hypothetical protein
MTRKHQAKGAANPYLTSDSPDDLGPSNRIAYDIIRDRRDVLPSVELIMNANLDDDARLRAITLFRDALTNPGDAHRDPAVAIARSSHGT